MTPRHVFYLLQNNVVVGIPFVTPSILSKRCREVFKSKTRIRIILTIKNVHTIKKRNNKYLEDGIYGMLSHIFNNNAQVNNNYNTITQPRYIWHTNTQIKTINWNQI